MNGLVKFGDNAWLVVDQIESVFTKDIDTRHEHQYQVVVRMVSDRKWTHTVATAPTGYGAEREADQNRAKAKRDVYLDDLLRRIRIAARRQ